MINFKSTRDLSFLGIGILMCVLVLYILFSAIGFLGTTLKSGLESKSTVSSVQHFNLQGVESLKK